MVHKFNESERLEEAWRKHLLALGEEKAAEGGKSSNKRISCWGLDDYDHLPQWIDLACSKAAPPDAAREEALETRETTPPSASTSGSLNTKRETQPAVSVKILEATTHAVTSSAECDGVQSPLAPALEAPQAGTAMVVRVRSHAGLFRLYFPPGCQTLSDLKEAIAAHPQLGGAQSPPAEELSTDPRGNCLLPCDGSLLLAALGVSHGDIVYATGPCD